RGPGPCGGGGRTPPRAPASPQPGGEGRERSPAPATALRWPPRPRLRHEGLDQGEECQGRERLGQVLVGTRLAAADAIRLLGRRRQHHDGGLREGLLTSELAADLETR